MIPFCQWCGGTNTETHRDGALRPVCSVCDRVTYLDPKLAVAVVVSRGERLLLGLRAPGSREAGRWSFPAGFVERGEVVEVAAVREAREETGLDVQLTGLLGLYSTPGETVVLAVYAADVVSGSEVAADDLADLGWFDPADLPELAFPHDRRIVADWAAWRGKK